MVIGKILENYKMEHIVIFRTSGSYIDYNTYNCQELGLAKALLKKGFKVSLVMAGPVTKHIEYEYNEKLVDIYYLRYKSLNQSLCLFDGWQKLLEQLKPNVIQLHEFGMFMSYLVSTWAKRKGIRCVLIQGNYNTTLKPGLKQLECLFNMTFGKAVLRNVEAIGCKTIAAAEYIERYSDKQTYITPVGLDDSKFAGCCLESDFRRQYNLEDKKILLYIVKMEPRRNPFFLLELMKQMPNEYVLVMVGEGPLFQQVKNKVRNESIRNVFVMGKKKQEELPAIYTSSDLFLLASNYEIFGMVILESMYFGTPVISTATAGANTLIDETTGCLVDDLDVANWKNTIVQLCSNSIVLEMMKNHCQDVIRDNYIWDKAADKFKNLYIK